MVSQSTDITLVWLGRQLLSREIADPIQSLDLSFITQHGLGRGTLRPQQRLRAQQREACLVTRWMCMESISRVKTRPAPTLPHKFIG